MLFIIILFVQLPFLAAAAFPGGTEIGSDQHENRNNKSSIEPKDSDGDKRIIETGTEEKDFDERDEAFNEDDIDVDINAILGTVGMPKCIGHCIKSLSAAMGRLLQFNKTLDKFNDICNEYDEAVRCIHKKVPCLGANIFDVITRGVDSLCMGPKKQFVQKNKVCLGKHMDNVSQGCDRKCHFARALAQFSHRSDLRGVGLVHLLSVINADSGPVCASADCFLHCFREEMNRKCAHSGGVITDGLLRPFYYLANLIQKSGLAIRDFLEKKLPKECRYLTKKEFDFHLGKLSNEQWQLQKRRRESSEDTFHMATGVWASTGNIRAAAYHPGYFGKVGMRNFHVRKNHYYCPTINLDKLWTLCTERTRKQYAEVTDKAPVIDVVRAGFHKVLGKGLLPKQPMIVKAKYFSHTAEEKIRKVGGACVLVS
uniref:Large ribosomal subunit protein uL15 n=1 Tax=Globodera rostochiensis TaxID=31243 RepID=A0A914GQ52_GLORO